MPTAKDSTAVDWRVDWEQLDKGYGAFGEVGFVGSVEIFSVGYHDRGRYYLTCRLPGIKDRVLCESQEEAKDRALRMLAVFFRQLRTPRVEAGSS